MPERTGGAGGRVGFDTLSAGRQEGLASTVRSVPRAQVAQRRVAKYRRRGFAFPVCTYAAACADEGESDSSGCEPYVPWPVLCWLRAGDKLPLPLSADGAAASRGRSHAIATMPLPYQLAAARYLASISWQRLRGHECDCLTKHTRRRSGDPCAEGCTPPRGTPPPLFALDPALESAPSPAAPPRPAPRSWYWEVPQPCQCPSCLDHYHQAAFGSAHA